MNMKKIMATVAAAALAVSAMATSAFAAGGMYYFSHKTHFTDPGAASLTVKGDNLLTAANTLVFTVNSKFAAPDGYAAFAPYMEHAQTTVKGAKVTLSGKYDLVKAGEVVADSIPFSVTASEALAAAGKPNGVYTIKTSAAALAAVTSFALANTSFLIAVLW